MKAKTDEQPGASELEGLGEAVGGVLGVGAHAVGEVLGRAGAALGMESAEPVPGQNKVLQEPVVTDSHLRETIQTLKARGEQNVRAVTAYPDWRKTPIENHGG